MSELKNIAISGAAGSLGKPILKALIDSGKFNITVLVRSKPKTSYPSSVIVKVVDFDSLESLAAAFKGIDAVVSAVGSAGLQGQTVAIDAALAAGVKRFIPSEFGSDMENLKTGSLPVFGYKVQTNQHIKEKARENPGFTYTLIRNCAFLDWGLEYSFLLDWKSDAPALYNGGDVVFSATTLKSVAQAVIGVLTYPEETKNKAVYVEDIQITQNRILALAREIAPSRTWNPVNVDVDEMKSKLDEKMANGTFNPQKDIVGYIFPAIFGKGYGGRFEKNDNKLLGVRGDLTDEDVKAILKPLLTT